MIKHTFREMLPAYLPWNIRFRNPVRFALFSLDFMILFSRQVICSYSIISITSTNGPSESTRAFSGKIHIMTRRCRSGDHEWIVLLLRRFLMDILDSQFSFDSLQLRGHSRSLVTVMHIEGRQVWVCRLPTLDWVGTSNARCWSTLNIPLMIYEG